MHSIVIMLAACAACARTVSEPNAPPPPATLDVPYAGRIVVTTPLLRRDASGFAEVWHRRLQILGVTAHVTYDDDRSIFDVYGTAPDSLAGIAAALADPTVASIDRDEIDGELLRWLPPMHGCECGGRAEIRLDPHQMCAFLHQTEFRLVKRGLEARIRGRVIVKPRLDPAKLGVPEKLCPPDNTGYFPHSVMFDLPTSSNPTAIVLALGGGALPGAARVESVVPARQP